MDILICDDEPLAIERLSSLVTQLGHQVVATAAHGQQAIELTQQHEPDVVLIRYSNARNGWSDLRSLFA